MAHIHPVVDSDSRFVINSTTRAISTASDKLELIQGDHQSERITFEIPKIVEGHDMSLCDRIEVHYINIDRKTKLTSKDIYIADDTTVENDKVTFSWLISGNATKYYGRLNFIVLFECLDEDGNYTYKWNTEICKLLTVGEGISNTESVSEDYSDILEKFKKEVIGEAFESVVKFTEQELTDEQKSQARENIGAISEDSLVQPDWNQGNSTAKDYIKNRTHWTERGTEIMLLPETEIITEVDADGGDPSPCGTIPFDEAIGSTIRSLYEAEAETVFTVMLDGAEYECGWINEDGERMPGIGNIDLGYDEGAGLSFFINLYDAWLFSVTAGTHVLSISARQDVVHKIDRKYLSQPNWAQNDRTAPDYIENRPFYKRDPIPLGAAIFTATSETTMTRTTTADDTSLLDGIHDLADKGFVLNMLVDGQSYVAGVSFMYGTIYIEGDINGNVYYNTDRTWTLTIENESVTLTNGKDYEVRFWDATERFETIPDEYIPYCYFRSGNAPVDFGTGNDSTTEGYNTTASGGRSHAEGYNTTASGDNSHAEGVNTIASGNDSHAEGVNTTASGDNSHAEGNFTTAFGRHSHAEGSITTASGNDSHAEGVNTTASGENSHAEGHLTTASGDNSHAEGRWTKASGDNSHAEGNCNIEDTTGVYAHIVGNGSGDTTRSNAYTLDWNGNGWFAGDVYTGSTSGTNRDDGSKKLATEEFCTNHTQSFQIDSTASDYSTTDTAYGDQIKSALLDGRDAWYIGSETDESGKTTTKYTKVSWFNIEKTDMEAKLTVGVGARTDDNSGAVTFAITI